MKQETQDLLASVARLTTVKDSVLAYVAGQKVKLEEAAAAEDWAAVKSITAELDTDAVAIADAIVTGTVAASEKSAKK